MKNLLYVMVLMISVFGPVTVYAGLAINNMYEKNDYFYVVVEYENDTDQTYKTITIKCDALDRNDEVIGSNQKSISPPREGLIKPGFKSSTRIPIQVSDQKIHSVSCNSNLQ